MLKTPVFWFASLSIVTLLLGGAATTIGPWYYSLTVPQWKPPDWAFGPVWTVIYVLLVWSGTRAWSQSAGMRGEVGLRRRYVVAFVLNAVLNIGWSVLFFAMQRPDLAQIEVVALWLSILWMIRCVWPISVLSAVLLFPYLAWVSLAAALTFWIVNENAPFG